MELLEAVRSGLAHTPQLEAQRAQVDIAVGTREIETGAFDTLLQSGLNQTFTNAAPLLSGFPDAIGPGTDTANQTAFSVGASKLFRNGISVSPTYQLLRTTDSVFYPNGYNSAVAGLTVSIPILRGRGAQVVAAQERAASLEVKATQYDLDFLLASVANAVAQSYWELVAAYRNLDVAQSAESRGQTYVDNTQALIDADHVPRSDLNEVKSNLAQRTEVRISAQNAVITARQNLATAMGRTAEEILMPLSDPADDFPAVPDSLGPSDAQSYLQRDLAGALTQRADYLAALTRKQKAGVLIPAAENALLPALNATLASGYEGLHGGRAATDFFSTTYSGVRGPNVSGGLTFSFPVGNHAAIGALEQARATLRQSDASLRDLARAISQGVTLAIANVRSATLRVRATRDAVNLTEDALTGAREKYRSGFGSVVEILQIEDRLNAALSDQVQARLDYALAITEYRFAVGTLVPTNQDTPVIQKSAFVDPIIETQP